MYIANPHPHLVNAFIGLTMLTTSMHGGTLALMPAYQADVFGPRDMTRIQSKIFTANIFSAMTGPTIAVALRDNYQYSNQYLLNSNVNYSLQFNDFFMFSSIMMVGAILCNSRITEIGKI